ncbi:unnamed protein product [Rhodiola kirilowii]
MADHLDSSPLIAPAPFPSPTEIDPEDGPEEQIQFRICLESYSTVLKILTLFVWVLTPMVLKCRIM